MPLYGSSRLGEWRPRRLLDIAAQENTVTTASGEKTYELSNHLGNVLAVVSDALIDDAPSVVSATDYYAFGQEMVGRTYASEDYRYGFNGKERENDFWGDGNAYDFGARINDPRLGRWLSRDPLAAKYPSMSPYCSMGNNPILFIDPDGKDIIISYYDNVTGQSISAGYKDGQLYMVDTKNTILLDKPFNTNNVLDVSKEQKTNAINFIQNIKTQLNVIKSNNVTQVNEAITFLQNDKDKSIITNVDKNGILGQSGSETGPRGGTTVTVFDANKNKEVDKEATDDINLVHEIKHMWNIRNKKTNPKMWNTEFLKQKDGPFEEGKDSKGNTIKKDGVLIDEIDAVNFENVYRDKIGKSKRTKMGSVPIDKEKLIDSKSYKNDNPITNPNFKK